VYDTGAVANQGGPECRLFGEMAHDVVGMAEAGGGNQPFDQLAQRIVVAASAQRYDNRGRRKRARQIHYAAPRRIDKFIKAWVSARRPARADSP
jgi:hypothetical protein